MIGTSFSMEGGVSGRLMGDRPHTQCYQRISKLKNTTVIATPSERRLVGPLLIARSLKFFFSEASDCRQTSGLNPGHIPEAKGIPSGFLVHDTDLPSIR